MSKLDQDNTNKSKTEVAMGVLLAELDMAKECLQTYYKRYDGMAPELFELKRKLEGIQQTVFMLVNSLHPDPKPLKVYTVNTPEDVIKLMLAEGETEERAWHISRIALFVIAARGWTHVQHRVFFPQAATRAERNRHTTLAEGFDGMFFQPPKETPVAGPTELPPPV